MRRVLATRQAAHLEFSPSHLTASPHAPLFYLKHCLPKIGQWISGHNAAYTYLADTITTFPYGDNFCTLVKEAGFSHCSSTTLTLGIATLYVAEDR